MRHHGTDRRYILALCLTLICFPPLFSLSAQPALATEPARSDVLPQTPYGGVQLRNITLEGVTITHTTEPQYENLTRVVEGRMAGDTIRVRGDIFYTAPESGNWSVILKQGNTTRSESGLISPARPAPQKPIPFDVSLPVDPAGERSVVLVKVIAGNGTQERSVQIVGAFFNNDTSLTPPKPINGHECCVALLLPLVAVGLAGWTGRQRKKS